MSVVVLNFSPYKFLPLANSSQEASLEREGQSCTIGLLFHIYQVVSIFIHPAIICE